MRYVWPPQCHHHLLSPLSNTEGGDGKECPTEVFKAGHTPRLQPERHVYPCKRRLINEPLLQSHCLFFSARQGRSWCNVDVGIWGERWRQQQAGSQQMGCVRSKWGHTPPRLHLCLRLTVIPWKMILFGVAGGLNDKYRPKTHRYCWDWALRTRKTLDVGQTSYFDSF